MTSNTSSLTSNANSCSASPSAALWSCLLVVAVGGTNPSERITQLVSFLKEELHLRTHSLSHSLAMSYYG